MISLSSSISKPWPQSKKDDVSSFKDGAFDVLFISAVKVHSDAAGFYEQHFTGVDTLAWDGRIVDMRCNDIAARPFHVSQLLRMIT